MGIHHNNIHDNYFWWAEFLCIVSVVDTPPTACIIYDSVFGTCTAFTKSSAVYNVHRLFCLTTQSCSLCALIAAVICMHEQLLASSPGSQSMERERWGGKICGAAPISTYLYPYISIQHCRPAFSAFCKPGDKATMVMHPVCMRFLQSQQRHQHFNAFIILCDYVLCL